jgi:hypothetical protein
MKAGGIFSMEKTTIIISGLIFAVFFVGICASQGMGGSKAYDQSGYDYMGTPVTGGNQGIDYTADFNPYSGLSSQIDPLSTGISTLQLQLEPIDPASEGLSVGGGQKLANQLYLQSGQDLYTEGAVTLGEPYVLWARITGKGSLRLYDYNRQILNQGYVAPGWYRITGAYADYAGQHIYRFVLAGLASNNLTIIVNPGGYPTSFSLTGKVVDQSGRPMAGVMVIASNSDGGKFSTTTGPAGYYAIDVATGAYLVNAEYPGYVFTSVSAQAIAGTVSAARPIVGTPGSAAPFGA